jgi:hypothetical protein
MAPLNPVKDNQHIRDSKILLQILSANEDLRQLQIQINLVDVFRDQVWLFHVQVIALEPDRFHGGKKMALIKKQRNFKRMRLDMHTKRAAPFSFCRDRRIRPPQVHPGL